MVDNPVPELTEQAQARRAAVLAGLLSQLVVDLQRSGETMLKSSADETITPAMAWYWLGRSEGYTFIAKRLRELLEPTVTTKPEKGLDINAAFEEFVRFMSAAVQAQALSPIENGKDPGASVWDPATILQEHEG